MKIDLSLCVVFVTGDITVKYTAENIKNSLEASGIYGVLTTWYGRGERLEYYYLFALPTGK